MAEQTVHFYPARKSGTNDDSTPAPRLEPATCTEAESFVLRVLDDSMEPEFRKGCMIVIDPTGRATDGSYVLAHRPLVNTEAVSDSTNDVGEYVFRQLRREGENQWTLHVLNQQYPQESAPISLNDVVGVIVQRAGVRRAYHKRYD
ncbi:MAG: S24 family peptidase [Granulosicoccus sp.]|nr:S24 family peptidase [Granulosicoccus sp.]